MEIMEIVSKVVGLLTTVKRVQEIAIWQRDTDILYLDGTRENLNCGCYILEDMEKLENILNSILSESGYRVWFSGYSVSWERVHIYLDQDSEIAKQYLKWTPVVEDGEEVDSVPIGCVYFHR